MKLTLVKPNIGRMEHSLYVDEGRMEPLQLGVLAALVPPDVSVVIYDDRMEEVPFDEPTDLVGITVETYTARRAYEIADEYRRRGVPVVLGGFHCALIPEEAKRHADTIVIGDAEEGWARVIEDARRGRLEAEYRLSIGEGQRGVLPRRDLFTGKGYLPISLMQYTRGCRHACTFCAISVYFGQNTFTRPVADMVREVEDAGRRMIFFVDDNIVADRAAAKELFRALIPMKVHWVSQATIDMTLDAELMDLMVKSGCMGHVIGFESLNPKDLAAMGKSHNLKDGSGGFDRAVEVLRDHGLQTWAAFTMGHDADTVDSIRRTVDWAIEKKFAFAAYNILMPYPGTSFYDELAREGRLLYDGRWWLHPEYRFNHAAFVPRGMTPDELTEACLRARTRFNSPSSILRRFLDLKTHLRTPRKALTYWAYTPLFRKEVRKKHGMRFGRD